MSDAAIATAIARAFREAWASRGGDLRCFKALVVRTSSDRVGVEVPLDVDDDDAAERTVVDAVGAELRGGGSMPLLPEFGQSSGDVSDVLCRTITFHLAGIRFLEPSPDDERLLAAFDDILEAVLRAAAGGSDRRGAVYAMGAHRVYAWDNPRNLTIKIKDVVFRRHPWVFKSLTLLGATDYDAGEQWISGHVWS